ncbi:outer membrane lipoprotein chaperone LolA [Orbaceae bacterium ESL0721]|nr:outer membrane lipoprotein chaperone LolA [Orbaceae bacterium ESL0721]
MLAKNFLFIVGLLVSFSAFAGNKEILQQRLDKIEGFSAQFSQKVTTADKQLVQQGEGDIWVMRPYYFNWTMSEPDVTEIISDGKNMWIYTPAVEQVTIMDLNKAVDNRLLLLITDSQSPIWNLYNVTRVGNAFTLTPTDDSSQDFIISVLPTGMIANFTIIDKDGQRSFYDLSHQKLGRVDMQKFQFTPPIGVTIDDQR